MSTFSACVLIGQDVQLTKDNVPVIYHDWHMTETGIDAPLHNLNLEQVCEALSIKHDVIRLTCVVYVHK